MEKSLVSTVVLIVLMSLCTIPVSVSPVKAQPTFGSVRIMPDGHVEGTDKIQVSGNVYTLTDDLNGYLNDSLGELAGFMLVMRDNVVIDGAGHTIQGNGTGVGIFLRGIQGVTVKNLNIKGFAVGISTYVLSPVVPLDFPLTRVTDSNRFVVNNIEAVTPESTIDESLAGWGIYIEFANNTLVSGNTIKTQNPQKGVFIGAGFVSNQFYSNNTLLNNKFVGCGLFLYQIGDVRAEGNTIDGKPLVFLRGASNQVVDGAEQVFLSSCSNISVKNVHPSADYFASVQLEKTSGSEITDCGGVVYLTNSSSNNRIHGNSARMIGLFRGSNHNEVYDNRLTNGSVIFARSGSDYEYANTCIKIEGASDNNIYQNTLQIRNNGIGLDGISLGPTERNNIYLNTITSANGASGTGISSSSAQNNTIHTNNIVNCGTGISLTSSNQLKVFQNNITGCGTGVSIWQSSSNTFYSNNFLNNTQQVYEDHYSMYPPFRVESTNNMWFNSSLKRGNYWSDYDGTDTDGDGIGDVEYAIFENYTDPYPLTQPFVSEESPPPLPGSSPQPSPSPSPSPTPSQPPLPTPTPTTTPTATPSETSSPSPSSSPSTTQQLPTSSPQPQPSGIPAELIYGAALATVIIAAAAVAVYLKRKKTASSLSASAFK
jgi:putative cofactor-binding repeat protein